MACGEDHPEDNRRRGSFYEHTYHHRKPDAPIITQREIIPMTPHPQPDTATNEIDSLQPIPMDDNARLRIKNFMVEFVLPRLTNKFYEDRGFFASYSLMSINIEKKHNDFGEYLEQKFSMWGINRRLKTCDHAESILNQKFVTLLDLLIFKAQHGYYEYEGYGCGGYRSFYVDRENHTYLPFGVAEDILGGDLIPAVRGVYNHLNIEKCLKYDCDNDRNHSTYDPIRKIYPPNWNRRDFRAEYWEMQAYRYFGNYAPLTNKGCHSCKIGYTPDRECFECVFFKKFRDKTVKFQHCTFDYWKKYGWHHSNILPDDGKTYACENFKKRRGR